jgi:hypothetical protein
MTNRESADKEEAEEGVALEGKHTKSAKAVELSV